MKPGDIVVALLPGAHVTKARPAVVVSTERYLAERPDAIVGILTTRKPPVLASSDYVLVDWRQAGLRAESCLRAYLITSLQTNLSVVGQLTPRDWAGVRRCRRERVATQAAA